VAFLVQGGALLRLRSREEREGEGFTFSAIGLDGEESLLCRRGDLHFEVRSTGRKDGEALFSQDDAVVLGGEGEVFSREGQYIARSCWRRRDAKETGAVQDLKEDAIGASEWGGDAENGRAGLVR